MASYFVVSQGGGKQMRLILYAGGGGGAGYWGNCVAIRSDVGNVTERDRWVTEWSENRE